MNSPEKGMSPEQASLKKISGHINEYDYADLISANVNAGGQTRKMDVLDGRHDAHSVKAGKKWQIFLYSRERFERNTVFQLLGEIPNYMISCIDTLPKDRDDRVKNSGYYKIALQNPMRKLAEKLQDKKLLEAFMSKAFFESGGVKYLAILPVEFDQIETPADEKIFHVFDSEEVINTLCNGMVVRNSMARNKNQYDAQKVIFRHKKNMGEIELRTDKKQYGRMKMWFDAKYVLSFLQEKIIQKEIVFSRVMVYGKGIRKMQYLRNQVKF